MLITGPTRADERRELGKATYAEIFQVEPPDRPSVRLRNCQLDQEMAELWNRTLFTRTEKRWISLACVAAQGVRPVLRRHVYGALKSGDISVDQMNEAVYHLALYFGTPQAEQWDDVLWEVADELGLQPGGEVDLAPRSWASESERIETGVTTFVDSMTFPPPPLETGPYTYAGVVATVFAELWTRGVLTQRERRLITLAGVGMSATETPIVSHVQGAMASGDLSRDEMHEFVLHFAFYAGWPKASGMSGALGAGNALFEKLGGTPS